MPDTIYSLIPLDPKNIKVLLISDILRSDTERNVILVMEQRLSFMQSNDINVFVVNVAPVLNNYKKIEYKHFYAYKI